MTVKFTIGPGLGCHSLRHLITIVWSSLSQMGVPTHFEVRSYMPFDWHLQRTKFCNKFGKVDLCSMLLFPHMTDFCRGIGDNLSHARKTMLRLGS